MAITCFVGNYVANDRQDTFAVFIIIDVQYNNKSVNNVSLLMLTSII